MDFLQFESIFWCFKNHFNSIRMKTENIESWCVLVTMFVRNLAFFSYQVSIVFIRTKAMNHESNGPQMLQKDFCVTTWSWWCCYMRLLVRNCTKGCYWRFRSKSQQSRFTKQQKETIRKSIIRLQWCAFDAVVSFYH